MINYIQVHNEFIPSYFYSSDLYHVHFLELPYKTYSYFELLSRNFKQIPVLSSDKILFASFINYCKGEYSYTCYSERPYNYNNKIIYRNKIYELCNKLA